MHKYTNFLRINVTIVENYCATDWSIRLLFFKKKGFEVLDLRQKIVSLLGLISVELRSKDYKLT